MRERKSQPTRQPSPGYEWVQCRTCDGFGEVIGRWTQVLGGARTRCPRCFRLGWVEHWIAGSTSRPPSEDDSQPEGDGLPAIGDESRAVDSINRGEEGVAHGEPDRQGVHLPTDREGRSSYAHGGPRVDRRSRATYHYARNNARSPLCEPPTNTRGERKRRVRNPSLPLLEIGDPVPADGQLCVICEAVSIGGASRPPGGEKRDTPIEGAPGSPGSGDAIKEGHIQPESGKVSYHYVRGHSLHTLCGIARDGSTGKKWRGRDVSPRVLSLGAPVPRGGRLCDSCSVAFEHSRRQVKKGTSARSSTRGTARPTHKAPGAMGSRGNGGPIRLRQAFGRGIQSFPLMAGITVMVGAFAGVFLVFPLLPDVASEAVVELQQRFGGIFGR